MKLVSLAVSGSFLVMLFAVPSRAQVASEPPVNTSAWLMARDRSLPSASMPMQTPQQVSAATASPEIVNELTPEQMGDLYMARKQYVEASQTFKRLSDQNPTNAVYLNKLGIALHQQEALTLAMRYYERALKVNPKYADAENNIGTIWYQRKKYGKAIKAYEKAIKINDDMAVLYSNLGYAYCGLREYPKAMDAFGQALARDPNIFQVKAAGGSILEQRSSDDPGTLNFMIAKSFGKVGDADHAAHFLKLARDDGYKNFRAAEKDPDFAMVIKDKRVQDVLLFQPDYAAQPSKTVTN